MPLVGVTINDAAGAWTLEAFVAVTVVLATLVSPLALVTVTVAENVPWLWYSWVAVGAV